MHDGLAAALPPIVALVAIAFGAFLAWRVAQIKVRTGGSAAGRDAGREYLLEEEARGEDEVSALFLIGGSVWCFGESQGGRPLPASRRRFCCHRCRSSPPPPFSPVVGLLLLPSLSLLVLPLPSYRRQHFCTRGADGAVLGVGRAVDAAPSRLVAAAVKEQARKQN